MRRWVAAFVVVAAASALAGAGLSPAGASVGRQHAYAKTCTTAQKAKGFVSAGFPWGQRCIRAGQYCKKVRNPEYHKYNFQCVNGKLRKQTGKKK
jgi:hypothetical protein